MALARTCAKMLDHAPAPSKKRTEHVPFIVLLCVLAALTFFGGSSRPDTLALIALRPILLSGFIVLAFLRQPMDVRDIRPLLILLGLFAAWIIVQLIPLPNMLWRALPGHQRFVMVDTLIGATPWRPISLVPDVTFGALIDLLVPLVVLVAMAMSGTRGKRAVPEIILLVALTGVLFALIQSLGNTGPLYRVSYPTISGIFANRNHQALMFAIGIPFAALWIRDGGIVRIPALVRLVIGGLTVLLLLGAILITGSRMGLALGGLGVVAIPFILPVEWLRDQRARWGLGMVVVLLVLAIASFTYLGRAQSIDRIIALRDMNSEGRIEFLPISWAILRDFFPFGTGISVFDSVFRSYEPDWALSPGYFNRAHNDWLDLAIGGGAISVILLLALCGVLVRAATRGLAQPDRRHWTIAALTSLLQIAIASAVDYPLRTPLLAGMCALICVLLLRPPHPSRRTL